MKVKETNGNFIVGLVKAQRESIFNILDADTIDFVGASEPYVREKIDALIYTLQLLKKQIKAVDKRQSTATTDKK